MLLVVPAEVAPAIVEYSRPAKFWAYNSLEPAALVAEPVAAIVIHAKVVKPDKPGFARAGDVEGSSEAVGCEAAPAAASAERMIHAAKIFVLAAGNSAVPDSTGVFGEQPFEPAAADSLVIFAGSTGYFAWQAFGSVAADSSAGSIVASAVERFAAAVADSSVDLIVGFAE